MFLFQSGMLYLVAAKELAFTQRYLCLCHIYHFLKRITAILVCVFGYYLKATFELLSTMIITLLSMYQDCERHLCRQDVSDCTI
jgi:hypothetical protein